MTLTIDYGTIAQIVLWVIALLGLDSLACSLSDPRADARWWLTPARMGVMLLFGLLYANHPGTWS